VKAAHPKAPVASVVGSWRHTSEMRAKTQLPKALEWLGLIGT
jgi:hypothetical protein